jgi:hypothetical protein
MSGNTTAPNNNSSLSQYVQSVIAGNTSVIYPDEQICQYVKAAVAAATADVPGAPSLDVAQLVRAAIGA